MNTKIASDETETVFDHKERGIFSWIPKRKRAAARRLRYRPHQGKNRNYGKRAWKSTQRNVFRWKKLRAKCQNQYVWSRWSHGNKRRGSAAKAACCKNVENERILKQELSKLTLLKDSPYFGRIDILDQGEEEPESLYIGTASFAENNRNFLVYDWRAPISSIFYNGTLGNVQYETPMGIQTTELVKKDSSRSSTAKSDTCLIPTKPSATKCFRPF